MIWPNHLKTKGDYETELENNNSGDPKGCSDNP